MAVAHSLISDRLADSRGPFGSRRIHNHDSLPIPEQNKYLTRYGIQNLRRDTPGIDCRKFVHDEAPPIALVEPPLKRRLDPSLS